MKKGDLLRPDVSLDIQVSPDFAEHVDLELLRRVVNRALSNEGVEGPVEISIVITDDASIQSLNATYRGINEATDVLSFPQMEAGEAKEFISPPGQPLSLGDIVISFPRASEQAVEYGHSLERELGYLTVHGVLHLLGYDHENESEKRVMRAKEEAALVGD